MASMYQLVLIEREDDGRELHRKATDRLTCEARQAVLAGIDEWTYYINDQERENEDNE